MTELTAEQKRIYLAMLEDGIEGEVGEPGNLDEVELREFVSRSNGRGRGKRKPRGVSLLRYGDKCWQVRRGEIISRQDGSVGGDKIAQETLTHLPEEERTSGRLLKELRRRA